MLPGNAQAFTDTPIYARTSGYLKKWYADIGAHVKAGQLLAEIETPELDQQLQQAQADLKDAQANLQISQVTAGRYQALLSSNSVSKQETDQALSDLRSKQALVDSSEANIRRLQDLQSFEKLYAPFDGVITARNTDIGALIQAGDTTPKELFHLSAVYKLRVYIAVPEIYSERLSDGEKVGLTLDSFPGETFQRHARPQFQRDRPAIAHAERRGSMSIIPRASSCPARTSSFIFPFRAAPGAVTIPSNTLLFRSEGLRVGVVRDGHVALVPITIGHDYGATVEVIAGLTPQDAVILDPSDSLADGATVQIDNPAKK